MMHDAQTKFQFPREIFGQLDHNLDIYAPHSPGTFPVREFHFDSDLNFVAECFFTSILVQISGDSLLPWDGLHNPCDCIFQHSHSFGKFPILTRQSKQCGFSIYTFDSLKSKSMVRLVRAEKMVLSGLVFARKIARMNLIQNI